MEEKTKATKLFGMFSVVFIAYFIVNFFRYAGGISAPILVQELSLTPSQVGLFGAIFTYTYAFANFPVGLLIDKFGSRKLIAFLYLIAAIGTLIMGVTKDFTMILAGRVLIAVGIAPVYAAASKASAEWVKAEKFTLMNGWLQSFGRAGGVLATTPLVLIISAIGWRNTYYILAAVSIVIAIAAYLLILEKAKPIDGQQVKRQSMFKGLGVLIKQPQYWLTLIYMVSLNATTVNIFANWGGVFLKQGLKLDAAVSSKILLVGSIAAACGAVISGYISYKKSAKFAGYIGQTLLLIACAVLAFFTNNLTVGICYATFFTIGLVEMYVIASGFSLLRTLATPKYVGTAFGFGNLIIWICGSSIVSQLWGMWVPKDYALSGFKAPLMFHVCLVALGLICLKFVKEEPIKALVDESSTK